MTPKFKSFILQLGYAEDSIIGLLCFEHRTGFDTVTGALRHLRSSLGDYLGEDEDGAEEVTCCTTAREAGQIFCSTCGRDAKSSQPSVDGAEINNFLYGLLSTTCEGSMDLFQMMEEVGWQIQAIPSSDSIYVQSLNRWLGDWAPADAKEDEEEGPEGFLKIYYTFRPERSWCPDGWGTDRPEPTAVDIFGESE